jgi:nucleotide-binding universal stress UspA family protein
MSRIVVGIDGSELAQRALEWAVDEARRRGAVLEVVHAWTMPRPDEFVPVVAEDAVRDAAERVLAVAIGDLVDDSHPPEVLPRLVEGPPANALLAASKGADLLVVGSHGHGGFVGMLLGSVSQRVLHHATCPVVVVRGTDAAAA